MLQSRTELHTFEFLLHIKAELWFRKRVRKMSIDSHKGRSWNQNLWRITLNAGIGVSFSAQRFFLPCLFVFIYRSALHMPNMFTIVSLSSGLVLRFETKDKKNDPPHKYFALITAKRPTRDLLSHVSLAQFLRYSIFRSPDMIVQLWCSNRTETLCMCAQVKIDYCIVIMCLCAAFRFESAGIE